MQKIASLLLILVLLFSFSLSVFVSPIEAKHKAGHGTKKSPTLSASVAKNRRSIYASFLNLSTVKSVSYTLTYDTSDKGPQGASGSIKVGKSASAARTLLFGTCSGRVCTYHRGVKNIKLSADFILKTGGVVSYEKSFK